MIPEGGWIFVVLRGFGHDHIYGGLFRYQFFVGNRLVFLKVFSVKFNFTRDNYARALRVGMLF